MGALVLLGTLVLASLELGAAAQTPAAPAGQQAPAKDAIPDQVHSRSRRDGSLVITTGVVTRNDLEQVEVKDTKLDSDLVLRIVWGEVPAAFRDAQTFFERGDWANAAARFRLAAGDAGARPLVQAAARLLAGQALMEWGANEPARFGEAVEELQRFVTDNPTQRELPKARMLLARAHLMAGNAAEATRIYRELFTLGQAEKLAAGYDIVLCMRAGLLAARSALMQQPADTLAARTLYKETQQAASTAHAAQAPDSPKAKDLLDIADEASLGDGFVDLASGNAAQALGFFQGRVNGLSNDSSSAMRYACHLGLGESLLRQGKLREAQLELARVSAVEPLDRDRVARALLGMSECAQLLADSSSREWSRTWLTTVSEQFGDTPSASRARELLKTQ